MMDQQQQTSKLLSTQRHILPPSWRDQDTQRHILPPSGRDQDVVHLIFMNFLRLRWVLFE